LGFVVWDLMIGVGVGTEYKMQNENFKMQPFGQAQGKNADQQTALRQAQGKLTVNGPTVNWRLVFQVRDILGNLAFIQRQVQRIGAVFLLASGAKPEKELPVDLAFQQMFRYPGGLVVNLLEQRGQVRAVGQFDHPVKTLLQRHFQLVKIPAGRQEALAFIASSHMLGSFLFIIV
jgi:hypothetical protein